jgi:hypothetical protein
MENHFDAFSKSLAESVSRRESLRRLGAVFAGAALSALGLAAARGAHNQDECWDDEDCPQGLACCSGICVDLGFDNQNCGACGNVCRIIGSNSACCSGICRNIDFDNTNCGACDVVCPDGTSCQAGGCVPI